MALPWFRLLVAIFCIIVQFVPTLYAMTYLMDGMMFAAWPKGKVGAARGLSVGVECVADTDGSRDVYTD